MLSQQSREAHVRRRPTNLTIAILLTVLDAGAVISFGGVVWRTFWGIFWSKLVVVLLGALWATSLAKRWAYAYYDLRRALHESRVTKPSSLEVIPSELRGGGDV
jgi:hypothetical protein